MNKDKLTDMLIAGAFILLGYILVAIISHKKSYGRASVRMMATNLYEAIIGVIILAWSLTSMRSEIYLSKDEQQIYSWVKWLGIILIVGGILGMLLAAVMEEEEKRKRIARQRNLQNSQQGTQIPQWRKDELSKDSLSGTTVISGKSIYCPVCRAKHPEGRSVCQYCGTKLSQPGIEAMGSTCTRCGRPVADSASVCEQCRAQNKISYRGF